MPDAVHRRRALASVALLAFAPIVLPGCASGPGAGEGGSPAIAGSAIIALADGGLPYSAAGDGLLISPGFTAAAGTISRVPLPLPDPGPSGRTQTAIASVTVANSAIGPARLLAVSRDGRRALVLGTRGAPPASAATIRDLPPGGAITLVSVADTTPGVLGTVDLGPGVRSVSLSESGDFAVVARSTPEINELIFLAVSDRSLTIASRVAIPEFKPGPKVALSTVALRPDASSLAVTVLGSDTVWFYLVERGGDGFTLQSWGPPVRTGNHPYTCAWTPDGRHLITVDTNWGPADGFDLANAPASAVSVIRVAGAEQSDTAHVLTAQLEVGVNADGLAVSPVGFDATRDLVALGNLRKSFLPAADPRFTRGGSVTLLTIDRRTGEAAVLGEWPCAAGPKGLAFDARGEALLVPDFEEGVVQLWRVNRGGGAALTYTGVRLGVPRGVHALAVTP